MKGPGFSVPSCCPLAGAAYLCTAGSGRAEQSRVIGRLSEQGCSRCVPDAASLEGAGVGRR